MSKTITRDELKAAVDAGEVTVVETLHAGTGEDLSHALVFDHVSYPGRGAMSLDQRRGLGRRGGSRSLTAPRSSRT